MSSHASKTIDSEIVTWINRKISLSDPSHKIPNATSEEFLLCNGQPHCDREDKALHNHYMRNLFEKISAM